MAAGEGFAHLDDGSLIAGFFLLSKRGLVVKDSNNKEKIVKDYLDFGKLMVAVLLDGISSSALR
jgi:hypothetical protein